MLKTLACELGVAMLYPHIERMKQRLWLTITTYVVIALFSLLGMTCLFMLVFFSLANHYSPEIAAFLLLCFCVFMALGTLLIHELAGRAHTRDFEERFREEKVKLSREVPDKEELNRAIKRYFRDNKFAGLLATAVIGALVGARPGSTFRGAKNLLRGRRDRD